MLPTRHICDKPRKTIDATDGIFGFFATRVIKFLTSTNQNRLHDRIVNSVERIRSLYIL